MSDNRGMSKTQTKQITDISGNTPKNRNRAIDFYRAIAMLAVAFGHWLAIAVFVDESGGIVAGNALEYNPNMAWMSWVLQVMPLFFIVGGFSSAMSLDSHSRNQGKPQDWVAARLRRMTAPTTVLASFWLAALAIAVMFNQTELALMGASAGAIPLWFLANYTIDTAIAPFTLPSYRKNPVRFFALIASAFIVIDIAHVIGVPYVHHINWVIGWLIFQMVGFAWKDGKLPEGKRLAALAAGFWATAVALVSFGPWPVSMVHIGGIEFSPTHPPSVALMAFGLGYGFTAIFFAPKISAWLESNAKAWKFTVIANTVAMSVYLWHFTAAVLAGLVLHVTGLLPSADVGTFDWWVQKLPLIALSFIFLSAIVAAVNRYEVRALLAPREAYAGSAGRMMASAGMLSVAVKAWTSGDTTYMVAGIIGMLIIWHMDLKSKRIASIKEIMGKSKDSGLFGNTEQYES